MADVETGDVLRIGATFLIQSVYEYTNVFHVRVTAGGPLSFADAADDIGEYMTDIYNEFIGRCTDQMTSYLITLQNLTQDTTYGAFAWPAPVNGPLATQYLPLGVACLCWGRTVKPRVQVRKYWGVFTEGDLANGSWTAALLTDCQDALSIHLTSYAGTNGLTMLGVAYNRTTQTTTDATGVTSTAEPAYQRRRKRGRGS